MGRNKLVISQSKNSQEWHLFQVQETAFSQTLHTYLEHFKNSIILKKDIFAALTSASQTFDRSFQVCNTLFLNITHQNK